MPDMRLACRGRGSVHPGQTGETPICPDKRGACLPRLHLRMRSLVSEMHENTEFNLSRDCEAIEIPSGRKFTLEKGTKGVITQTLGGSYTIATPYGLSRISEKDLDALGLDKLKTEPKEKTAGKTNGAVSEDAV